MKVEEEAKVNQEREGSQQINSSQDMSIMQRIQDDLKDTRMRKMILNLAQMSLHKTKISLPLVKVDVSQFGDPPSKHIVYQHFHMSSVIFMIGASYRLLNITKSPLLIQYIIGLCTLFA